MNVDIRPLLNPTYWLSFEVPTVTGTFGRIVLAAFIMLFIAGIVVRIRGRKSKADRHKKLVVKRVAHLLMTWGVLGAILFFFSYEGIRVLGGRFWYAALDIAMIIWAVVIYRFAKKKVPVLQAEARERSKMNQYLPKAKKK